MEAAFIGAKNSKKYSGNETIAISPFFDKSLANLHADMVISTGLDIYRNTIVVNADAVIAIGGGAGTLSEIGNAWTMGKMIIGFANVAGWSAELAGRPVDHRRRYADIPNDQVWAVKTAQEVITLLSEKLPYYNQSYTGLLNKK
jgi:uncharacterized protein (TIGR00725 family)